MDTNGLIQYEQKALRNGRRECVDALLYDSYIRVMPPRGGTQVMLKSPQKRESWTSIPIRCSPVAARLQKVEARREGLASHPDVCNGSG